VATGPRSEHAADSTAIDATTSTASAQATASPRAEVRTDAAPASTPVASSAPLPAAAEQVLNAIEPMRHRGDGSYHLRLELNPHELGRVELSVELRDGVLSVHMQADRIETQRTLTEHLDTLRALLADRGVATGSVDVGDHRGSQRAFAQSGFSDGRRNPETASASLGSGAVDTINSATPEVISSTSSLRSTNRLDVHA
jgi:flagellar hook-length control protein FliK